MSGGKSQTSNSMHLARQGSLLPSNFGVRIWASAAHVPVRTPSPCGGCCLAPCVRPGSRSSRLPTRPLQAASSSLSSSPTFPEGRDPSHPLQLLLILTSVPPCTPQIKSHLLEGCSTQTPSFEGSHQCDISCYFDLKQEQYYSVERERGTEAWKSLI